MIKRKIVIFGAGKIGRSFIGQIFGRNGWQLVFVDVDQVLVDALNREGRYNVVIKGADKEEKLIIENLSALHFGNSGGIREAIARADMLAISVGKAAFASTAPLVARGLLLREELTPGRKLDIILAENMRAANQFFQSILKDVLPPGYPLEERLGLIESSIGKMVPLMSAQDLKQDPLQVFAEAYNTLILDLKGFRGQPPGFPELALKENMKAWVDRKVFLHNLGHATAAYAGHLKFPRASYLHEILEDGEIFGFTRNVMLESAHILMALYPGEFSAGQLEEHIDDLLARFLNQKLGDTIYRVGCDLPRKLGPDDRFMAAIRAARQADLPHDSIVSAMKKGLHFKATDEKGRIFEGDKLFHEEMNTNAKECLKRTLGLDEEEDMDLLDFLLRTDDTQ